MEPRSPCQVCVGWESGSPSPCRSLGDAATCWPHAGHAAPSSPSGPSPSPPSRFLPSPLLPSPSPGSESLHHLSRSEQPRSPHHAQAREPPRSGAALSTAGLSTVGRLSHRWRAVVSCEAALVASIRHALLPWGVADIRGPPRPTVSQGHSGPSPTLTWASSRSDSAVRGPVRQCRWPPRGPWWTCWPVSGHTQPVRRTGQGPHGVHWSGSRHLQTRESLRPAAPGLPPAFGAFAGSCPRQTPSGQNRP